MTTQAARYVQAKDGAYQAAIPVDDATHKRIWGRFTYSNRPFADLPVVHVSDVDGWLDAQYAAADAAHAAYLADIAARREAARLATVEKAAMFMTAVAA